LQEDRIKTSTFNHENLEELPRSSKNIHLPELKSPNVMKNITSKNKREKLIEKGKEKISK